MIVADTGPLNYLILIGRSNILVELYGDVVIPQTVLGELRATKSPQLVKSWIGNLPRWVRISTSSSLMLDMVSTELDAGERDAIALAKELRADFVVLDDKAGRSEARRLRLSVTGTLGVLQAAAQKGLVDLEVSVAALERTSFWLSPGVKRLILGR